MGLFYVRSLGDSKMTSLLGMYGSGGVLFSINRFSLTFPAN